MNRDIEQPLILPDSLSSSSSPPLLSSPPSKVIPMVVALVVCMGSVAFGYQLGFTSPISALPSPPAVFETQSNFDTFSSLVSIGAMGGGLSGGPLADLVGRRRLLLINAIPYAAAMVGIYFAESLPLLYFLRLIIGFSSGLLSLLVPLYITEISPISLRGTLGGGAQLGVTIGILMAYLAGIPVGREGGEGWWREMALIGLIPIGIQFVGLLFFPESPTWLISKSKPQAEIEHAFLRIRGKNYNPEAEILEIRLSSKASNPSSTTTDFGAKKYGKNDNTLSSSDPYAINSGNPAGNSVFAPLFRLFSRPFVKPLVVAVGLQVLQQATGINAVIFFSGKIFSLAGTNATVATVIVGGVQVVVTFISCLLMDKAGRRPLLIIAAAGMGGAEVLLGFCFQFQDTFPGWVSIAATCLYISFFSLAMGPVPWFITAEIFPSDIRGVAMSVATVVNWLGAFAIVQATSPLLKATTPGAFWIFGGVCGVAVLFVLAVVPETKGKSYEQIESEFNSPR